MIKTFSSKLDFNGEYWRNRYESYLKHTINYIKKICDEYNINNTLEIGSYGIPLIKESDTIDRIKIGSNYPKYNFDITSSVWPIEDKYYDLAISCQVWEHLKGKQLFAFNELKRVSKYAILTLPYKWHCPGNCHHSIDLNVINTWTDNHKIEFYKIIKNKILLFYKF
ncbi:MAG: hypothetical protein ACOC33_02175 [bacterium]